MGWGDEIMVTGEAVRAQRALDLPVAVRGRNGKARWHPVFDNNPRLVRPENLANVERFQWLDNYSGRRPYIDYERSTKERWHFAPYATTPGELYLASGRKLVRIEEPEDWVVIEPHIKPGASPNKQWGFKRYQAVVDMLPHLEWVQLAPAGARILKGVRHIETQNFLDACHKLARARAALLPEGGLHHAAAAVHLPAVVLFGAFQTPARTGYRGHTNIAVDDPNGIGWRIPNEHCRMAWEKITPEMVAGEIGSLVNET